MTVTSAAKLREIAQAVDPKRALLDSIAHAAARFEVAGCQVLVATYIRPEKTKGGIILTDRSLAEDRFQGKVGLVVKVGPLAFRDDGATKFGGFAPRPGDWVMYRPADAMELFFVDPETGRDGTPCRLIEDVMIKGKIEDPSLIF